MLNAANERIARSVLLIKRSDARLAACSRVLKGMAVKTGIVKPTTDTQFGHYQ